MDGMSVYDNFNQYFILETLPHFLTGNIKSSCPKRTKVHHVQLHSLRRKLPTDSLRELPKVKQLGNGRIRSNSKSNLLFTMLSFSDYSASFSTVGFSSSSYHLTEAGQKTLSLSLQRWLDKSACFHSLQIYISHAFFAPVSHFKWMVYTNIWSLACGKLRTLFYFPSQHSFPPLFTAIFIT